MLSNGYSDITMLQSRKGSLAHTAMICGRVVCSVMGMVGRRRDKARPALALLPVLPSDTSSRVTVLSSIDIRCSW